jgi:hypothetical protein
MRLVRPYSLAATTDLGVLLHKLGVQLEIIDDWHSGSRKHSVEFRHGALGCHKQLVKRLGKNNCYLPRFRHELDPAANSIRLVREQHEVGHKIEIVGDDPDEYSRNVNDAQLLKADWLIEIEC